MSANRHVQIGSTKSLFDELIDRHAEAYLAAYPDIKEFSSYDKSGTIKHYIGMVWTNNNEKPDTNQLKIRGSQSLSKNKLLELDISAVDSLQSFFPGQIVAFTADPFLKEQLTVKKFLDPMRIAPPMKRIKMDSNINLLIASGPYMKPEQEDWSLFDKLIETIRSNNATHVILIGPFVDLDNKHIRAHYDSAWKSVSNKLVGGLHDHKCHVFLVPSNRDILPSNFSTNYFYPCSEFDLKLNLKVDVKPKCIIKTVTDPSQIDLGGLYLDVTSAEVLFQLHQCTSFINRGPSNAFTSIYKHLLTHGIYPLYPPPVDTAIDYPKLGQYLQLDRLGPHILVLPTRFLGSVNNVENRLIVTIQKCSTKKHVVLIEIPKIESTEEAPVDSVTITDYTHKTIDLCPPTITQAADNDISPSLPPTEPTKMIVDTEMAAASNS